ncbi:MAG: hypothetical protein ACT4PL_15035 [Phycisphaerales bacterium]
MEPTRLLTANAFKLSVRISLATLGAGLLVVVGVIALRTSAPAVEGLLTVVGWTAIAAGQVVFAGLVADRLFPHADARLTGGIELAGAAAFIGGIGMLVVHWLGSA